MRIFRGQALDGVPARGERYQMTAAVGYAVGKVIEDSIWESGEMMSWFAVVESAVLVDSRDRTFNFSLRRLSEAEELAWEVTSR